MKQEDIMFNGNPLNTNQTCTYINWEPYTQYPWYEPYKNFNTVVDRTIITQTFDLQIPEVYITKNKSRLKQYVNTKNLSFNSPGMSVYLEDGDEFEIEIFNCTTFTLGVKFKFNGEYISNNHLIFEPGQRFFLDRYIDTNNKFKFTTYDVEDNNSKVDNAIRFNGNVEIEFYKKVELIKEPFYPNLNNQMIYGNDYKNYDNNINQIYYTSLDTVQCFADNLELKSFKETGKVDKGSKSDQSFKTVDMDFASIYSFHNWFKILPLSQKPIEAKDLKPTCSNCKRKCKKHDKFCSGCGNKL